MANEKIREYAKASGIKLWQIAEALEIGDQWLSRKLRNELPEDETDRIIEIIDELRNSKADRRIGKPPLRRCNWSMRSIGRSEKASRRANRLHRKRSRISRKHRQRHRYNRKRRHRRSRERSRQRRRIRRTKDMEESF